VAPVLASIGNKSVDELATLSFTATATDADVPPNTLTFSLVGAPAGATINGSTGAFSWTPTEAQGPGTYPFTVKVTDNGSPNLSDSEVITVTVNEVNAAPVLASIGSKSVLLGDSLAFTASASDPDLPANTLTFALDAGFPAGASINPSTGQFSWTPTLAQAGLHNITIRVTDNGSPALSDTETIGVAVLYGVCAQFDQTKSYKKGSTIPVKINLCDATGHNVSASNVVVQALQLLKLSGTASPFDAEDSGAANPDNNFRFAGDSYIFNLSTKGGYSEGQWGLTFTVGTPAVSNPAYMVTFFIK